MPETKYLDALCHCHEQEWLLTNHRGSYAMGLVSRVPRRKYHSHLSLRDCGHVDPFHVLSDVGEYLEIGSELCMLGAFDFGNRIEPRGFSHLKKFDFSPVPTWVYEVGGLTITRSLELASEKDTLRIHYLIEGLSRLSHPTMLRLRPFITARPIHRTAEQNPFLDGMPRQEKSGISFQFYENIPRIHFRLLPSPHDFVMGGEWVEHVYYSKERERGYPAFEDFYVPGDFVSDLMSIAKKSVEPLRLCLEISTEAFDESERKLDFKCSSKAKTSSGAAEDISGVLENSAEKYFLKTQKDFYSCIAGFPWFGHWGRDTLISLAGFCFERGEFQRAEKILASYGRVIEEGLRTAGLISSFPEHQLILTGMDTPLLYVRAIQQLAEYSPNQLHLKFMPQVCKILDLIRHSSQFGIHVTPEAGLFVKPGAWAVSWMDVRLEGQPVTPRTGFAVDLNAMFINAIDFALAWAKKENPEFYRRWLPLSERSGAAFVHRFWSDEKGYLADTNDGVVSDFSLRPNQLWALALPHSPISQKMAESILHHVSKKLFTPAGLRTLAPDDPRYRGKYAGSQHDRDLAYHQGTVWPWFIGIYSDSFMKYFGVKRLREEIEPFIKNISRHLTEEGCLGHISEVFDGDSPHLPGGAPAQAWSLAEFIRVNNRLRKA